MDSGLDSVAGLSGRIATLAVAFAPRVIVAAALVVGGVYVGKWIGRFADRGLARFELERPTRQLLVRIVRVLVLGLFVIMALENIGIQLLPLLAGLGVASAGVALAMQGVLSNLAAGLMIILTRPYRIGEYISVAGEEGQVKEIELANTVLTTFDRSQIVIPNRKIVGEILHNYGSIRQLDVVVSVGPRTDLDKALATMDAIVRANSRCLRDPPAIITVSGFDNGAIAVSARPWVKVADYVALPGEIRKAFLEAFRARDIVAPAPIYERFIDEQAGASDRAA